MPQYCDDCGRENSDKARFCASCGLPLNPSLSHTEKNTVLDNRYEILSVVKSGAMGCVYKARDTRLETIVALKQMLSSHTSKEDIQYAEQRFREEAKLLSTLHHSGIPKVIDYFTAFDSRAGRNANYLAMTFVEGRDLETVMKDKGGKPFPLREALEYFKQILDILIYLHSQNPPVIYRDMNPRNIMLSAGKIFLVDFGIARIFSPQQKGTAIGTPGYASPEQYRGSAEPRSDLYSLGAVMHCILTGANPEESNLSLFTFDSPSVLNTSVPEWLDRLIVSMLDVVPANRPPSAQAIRAILDNPSASRRRRVLIQPSPVTKPLSQSVYSSSSVRQVQSHYSDIFEAIEKNDLVAVKDFIARGANINARNNRSSTPLHFAAFYSNSTMVELLAAHGAAIDAENNEGLTPLYFSVQEGKKKVVEFLLSKGAEINTKAKNGWAPLHVSASKGHKAISEMLIARGADINARNDKGATALSLAEMARHREIVELLRRRGAADSRSLMPSVKPSSPLNPSSAAVSGAAGSHAAGKPARFVDKVIKSTGIALILFIGLGFVHLFLPAPLQCSSIFEAIDRGDSDEVRRLIVEGTDVNKRSPNGEWTPLYRAARTGNLEIARILSDRGARVNDKAGNGWSPLHIAVFQNHKLMVEFLVSRGANVNAKNDDRKETPLQIAKQYNRDEMVSLLKRLGAR
ncbi:MAG: ankyrin repeat domain-containing protein [Candidatus Xenobiia bacterium LiM19]